MATNPYLGPNPYLQNNIDATLGDVSRNYQKTFMPQQAGAQVRSGSFGNSGQQQMQLEDQRNLGQTMGNIAANMRGQDYLQQQQMYQWDQGNQLANRAQDNSYELGKGNLALGNLNANNSYNLGLGQNQNQATANANALTLGNLANTTTMRGQDIGQQIANAANATQRYGVDTNAATARYGTDANTAIANQANTTTMRGQDNQYALGNAANQNQATANANQLLNYQNQYQLGLGQNANQRYGIDTGAAAQRYSADASAGATAAAAQAAADASRFASTNNYNLGMANNATQAQNYANNYDLGLRGNDYQFANLDANIANTNFQNNLAGANFGLNAYNTLQNSNNLGLTAANNIQNTPLNYFNTFNTAANNVGNGLPTTTNSATGQGSPLMGALAGWQLGNAFQNRG